MGTRNARSRTWGGLLALAVAVMALATASRATAQETMKVAFWSPVIHPRPPALRFVS